MTKSIEEQADEFTSKAFSEIEEIQHRTGVNFFADEAIQLIIKDTYLNAAKARDTQWSAVVNELRESMEFIHKKVGSCAYSQIDKWGCEMESVYRSSQYSLTKADQLLREMNIK